MKNRRFRIVKRSQKLPVQIIATKNSLVVPVCFSSFDCSITHVGSSSRMRFKIVIIFSTSASFTGLINRVKVEELQAGDIGAAVKLKDVKTGNTLNGKDCDYKFNFIAFASVLLIVQLPMSDLPRACGSR